MSPVIEKPTLSEALQRLARLDLTRILDTDEESFLRDVSERAQARVVQFRPVTVEERLESFKKINYRPHGLFVPDDDEMRRLLRQRVEQVGAIERDDERLAAYHALQDETESIQAQGTKGRWTGQQGVARSRAPFRIVAWGRRGGKTFHAAREALGLAVYRPRAWVWLAAPTMKLVSRAFDMVVELVHDLGLETRLERNTAQERLIVLRNGSKIEGMSLENVLSAAGASIDFAVIDEAAQIVPDAWYRAILPPLADRNGQALLISSYEGEGDFFHTQVLKAMEEKEAYGTESDWDYFQDPSWEVNFYAFPQGRKSPSIQRAERTTPPIEFLEQYGAVAAGARERVFPEFKEKVHVGDYRYQPGHPVRATIDPSTGINPYAVLALQDYDDHIVVIDEFYEVKMTAEDISPILKRRPWFADLTDAVVDSGAGEDEIIRWQRMGWPAFGVPEKPDIPERIPLYRAWLRDPMRFYTLYRRIVNRVLADMGLPKDEDLNLPPEQQRKVVIQVEEILNGRLSEQDFADLKACSHIFVNATCVNTITEHKSYSYQKRRKLNVNYKEVPRDYMNHTLDALGYYLWTYHRFDLEDVDPGGSYVVSAPLTAADVLPPIAQPREGEPPPPPSGFLALVRERYSPVNVAGRSVLA